MGKRYDAIDERLTRFIEAQRVYFVGSAPLSGDGHVNVSPRGLDSLRILGPRHVAFVDFVGSGIETLAHLRENGRIVLMFCAFEGPPKILRLHGRGRALERDDADWEALAARLPVRPDARAIIEVEVTRIADSCGYGVPLCRFESEREQLDRWVERKGPDGLEAFTRAENARSIDGLPGLRAARDD